MIDVGGLKFSAETRKANPIDVPGSPVENDARGTGDPQCGSQGLQRFGPSVGCEPSITDFINKAGSIRRHREQYAVCSVDELTAELTKDGVRGQPGFALQRSLLSAK